MLSGKKFVARCGIKQPVEFICDNERWSCGQCQETAEWLLRSLENDLEREENQLKMLPRKIKECKQNINNLKKDIQTVKKFREAQKDVRS